MKSFISREQDYALRITTLLSMLSEGETLTASIIADKLYISKKFAARIIHKLSKAEIVGTTRGINGGTFLKKNPEEISVYDILHSIGFKIKFNLCLHADEDCELLELCSYHSYFGELERQMMEKLKEKSITEFQFTGTNKTIFKNDNGGS
ncbi:MAG: Rrf2 family transcriptional regulator [Melioribacteraceae bacterium]|nr:Rrf2 family transcriptional regulator [Melioribacteraceae bacterium]MCF8354916.1 Rrf2 family transcriptional regulator [Melioribacteraceae bacterium]MCF8395241.1 Rrf2 family transcriptional regulator [Melioribacteraceae bacterium]MCF8420713.1 Rrf2 family transcriptional regulator [Melioribacteraceae bacterium]